MAKTPKKRKSDLDILNEMFLNELSKHKSKPNKNVGKSKEQTRGKKTTKESRKTTVNKPRKTDTKGKRKSDVSKLYKKSIPKNTNRKTSQRTKTNVRLTFVRVPNKEDKRKRGNVLEIHFHQKTFQAKINAINNWSGKELNYYIDRFSKFPQAVQIILTTKKGKDIFQRASRLSSVDFLVTTENTKKFILETMISFQDNYIEYIESVEPMDSDWVYDPSKIIAITVRFLY